MQDNVIDLENRKNIIDDKNIVIKKKAGRPRNNIITNENANRKHIVNNEYLKKKYKEDAEFRNKCKERGRNYYHKKKELSRLGNTDTLHIG